MRFGTLLLLSVLGSLSIPVSAQPRPSGLAVGAEVDVLPYLTGGHFGAVWIGHGHLRARALLAKVNMPQFVIPEGFTNHKIDSYAVVVDYFLDAGQRGWWIGSGLARWEATIQSEAKVETASFSSYLVHGSLGYSHHLTRHLYLSPWAGLSIRVGGDDSILVDGEEYQPPLLNPELSLKAGWAF